MAGVGCSSILKGLQAAKSKGASSGAPFDIINKTFFWLDVDELFSSSDSAEIASNFKDIDTVLSNTRNSVLIVDNVGGFIDGARKNGFENMISAIMSGVQEGRYQAILESHDQDLPKVLGIHANIKDFFTFIEVKEPDEDVLEDIVKGSVSKIEKHHCIDISDSAVKAAVELTSKYKTTSSLNLSKAQPQVSISLIDMAMSEYRRVSHNAISEDDKSVLDKIFDKKNNIESFYFELIAERNDRQEEVEANREEGRNRRDKQLDKLNADIKLVEKELDEITQEYYTEARRINQDLSLNEEHVTIEFSKASGIPIDKLNEDEQRKLLLLEDNLKKDVFSQDAAVKAMVDAILVSSVGLADPSKPRGAFMAMGASGVGKAQPMDSKVLTPDGFVEMRDISVGDSIITACGAESKVIGVYPQGERDVYEITFNDGRKVKSCKEHLWPVYGKFGAGKRGVTEYKTKIMQLSEIMDRLKFPTVKKTIGVPLFNPKHDSFPDANLPIDPWLLGFLIGDGSFAEHTPSVTTSYLEMIRKIELRLPKGMALSQKRGDKISYNIINEKPKSGSNILNKSLRDLDLEGKKSHEKFIPTPYLNASFEQRLELIRGLFDSDGYAGKNGTTSITTVSKKLSDNIVELIQGLGGIARVQQRYTEYTYKNEKKTGRLSYRIKILMRNPSSICTFSKKRCRLKSKHQYSNRVLRFENIELISKEQTQCIEIEHDSHLYVTDGYVPTHNTHISKRMAYHLFGSESAMLRFDMSEYMEKHAVAKLIGAPPGYDGYEHGGILTNQVRKNPHSIILFDEIEKADASVFDVFLQILDDGRLTDNRGVTVDFSSSFIIMTTNTGQEQFLDPNVSHEMACALAMQDLEKDFRPEFLNRIGGRENIIGFNSLDIDTIVRIAKVELAKANKAIKANSDISIVMSDEDIRALCETRYVPKMGARFVSGVFGSSINNAIARKVLTGQKTGVIEVSYDLDSDKVIVN